MKKMTEIHMEEQLQQMDSSIPDKVTPETKATPEKRQAAEATVSKLMPLQSIALQLLHRKHLLKKCGDTMLALSYLKPTTLSNSVNVQFSTSNTGTH